MGLDAAGLQGVHAQLQQQGVLEAAAPQQQAIGGAGYTAWSGLPNIFDFASPSVTFEGDNTVMAIQSNNFIKKLIKQVDEGQRIEHPLFAYLNDYKSVCQLRCSAKTALDFMRLDQI